MQVTDILQSIFRWLHVLAGIVWIGHLYFFNFVNGPMGAVLDGDTKKKVVPELMPRALFWFRMGAAWTWVTGVLLLLVVYYHGGLLLSEPAMGWKTGTFVMVALTFLGFLVYDVLAKSSVGKDLKKLAGVGLALIVVTVFLMEKWGGFGFRGYVIHIGAMFGTIMAFNVWFRIWPAQQKIIAAVKNGEKPDADLVAMAGSRSKQNTYLSVPLVWAMLNAHNTWSAGSWIILPAFVLLGWHLVGHMYKQAGKVKGM